MSSSQVEKAARFRTLHERPGPFVIPNPWDVASTRILEGIGFCYSPSVVSKVYPRDHSEPDFLDQSNHSLAAAVAKPFWTTRVKAPISAWVRSSCPVSQPIRPLD
jgi:hypothetical protein